jgi:oligo-1,6-glucosidase/glucan 1,6-alpha-glucosidase
MKHPISLWQKAVVYQIYPLSFMDSNDDGIGDILGIISKLSYIKDLGVDVIWLSPIYASPMDDNGYDISNYYEINPMFGSRDDFVLLLKKTHEFGMKLIMDLVVNHTSDEHIWFEESRKDLTNPYRDYYIWRDTPSDITSVFSGSAWELDELTNQYYFHLFSKKQPDLNWQNAKLRQAIYDMINYWLDLGIDGFRLDVIDLIGKDVDRFMLGDGPYLDERLKELYENCFKGKDVFTVGEMPSISNERAREITSLDHGYLNMIFHFGHLGLDEIPGLGKWELKPLNLVEMKQFYQKLQDDLYDQGWNSLFFANHDQPRAVSRYGSLEYRIESAKMLATVLYSMQGTPYVYQGEEIGMTGVRFDELDDYKDIETLNMAKEYLSKGWTMEKIMESIYAKSRDNSRTPMQWNGRPNSGFTKGTPWLRVNPNYHEINAKADFLMDNSIYAYYKKLFEIRKQYPVFDDGNFLLVDPNNPDLFMYTRNDESSTLFVIASFSKEVRIVHLEKYKSFSCLLANMNIEPCQKKMEIPPYYAAIYYTEKEVGDL